MAVKRYDGSQWVTVAGKGDQGTSSSIATWVKTATGGETSVSGNDDNSQPLSYTVGQELVFINGALQKRGSDYTATTGNSITGLTALAANDVVTVWTVNAFSVTGAIANSIVDAKGDLIVATGADTPGRLAVGSNGQVLTAASTTGTGLAWATPTTGAFTLLNTGGTSLAGAVSTTVSNISGDYRNLHIYVDAAYVANNQDALGLRINSESGANTYHEVRIERYGTTTATNGTTGSTIYLTAVCGNTDTGNFFYGMIPSYADTTHRKTIQGQAYYKHDSTNSFQIWGGARVNSNDAVTAITIVNLGGNNISGGTLFIYGEK